MKRLFLIFAFIFSITISNAEVLTFKADSYAYGEVINGRTVWGDWQPSSVKIVIDIDNERIIIYSPTIQRYEIVGADSEITRTLTGEYWKFYCIDKNGVQLHIRLRTQYDPVVGQLYVEYNNCAWVYSWKC